MNSLASRGAERLSVKFAAERGHPRDHDRVLARDSRSVELRRSSFVPELKTGSKRLNVMDAENGMGKSVNGRRHIGETWPLLLIAVGAFACLLDASTTWAALHLGGRFHEHAAATATLIASLGLTGGLVVSILLRVAVFALIAVAAERIPRLSKALLALGFAAVAVTWLIVFSNIAALAASSPS